MRTCQTVLATTDVEQAIPEVHLLPTQGNQFGNAQAMAISELNHGGIPVSMASKAFCRANEGVDLGGGEVFPAPPRGIGPLARWTDAVARRGAPGQRGREARTGLAIACSGSTIPKRDKGQGLPARGSESFPKRPFLGRVYPSRTPAGEKGQTKPYGPERGHLFLTVGFRTAAAANPISSTGRLAMLLTMGGELTPRGTSKGPENAAGVQRVRERGQTRWQDFA